MSFNRGDPVEYDSHYDCSQGCITRLGQKSVIRGVYVKRIDDVYSDVSVAGRKPLIVRTSRLRRSSAVRRSGGGEAA